MKLVTKIRIGNKITFSVLGLKIKYKCKERDFLGEFLKQWETDFNPKKLEKDIYQALKNPIMTEAHNREIFLILISTLLENGKKDEAANQLVKYIKKYDKAEIYPYPMVCRLAREIGMSDERIDKVAEIFDVLEKNRKEIKELLRNKKINVVGNSPNLKDKHLGKRIDECDYVVRFNNYQVKNFEEDYGSRTDVWICCQANDVENKTEEECRSLACIIYNVDLMHTKLREKCFQNIYTNLNRGAAISYIGDEYKKDLKSTGVTYPSSGLSGLYHLHNIQPLTRENIFGFSFLEDDTNYYDHYFAKRGKRKIKKFFKNCHHNFDKESIFLNNLFEKNND